MSLFCVSQLDAQESFAHAEPDMPHIHDDQEPSFFLLQTKREWQNIQHKIKAKSHTPHTDTQHTKTHATPLSDTYHIDAILFQDADHWSVWVNGNLLHPTSAKLDPSTHLRAVDAHSVELTHKQTHTLLFVGQTYNTTQNCVTHTPPVSLVPIQSEHQMS